MNELFGFVNDFFAFLAPITDAVWDFPTNIEWYRNIPVLGQFSFPVILLIGVGIYFTIRTRFIQGISFGTAVKIMLAR